MVDAHRLSVVRPANRLGNRCRNVDNVEALVLLGRAHGLAVRLRQRVGDYKPLERKRRDGLHRRLGQETWANEATRTLSNEISLRDWQARDKPCEMSAQTSLAPASVRT